MTLEEFYKICDSLPFNENGCQIWSNVKRRPEVSIKGIVGKKMICSRLILERKLNRPIKPKHLACHTCDNIQCVYQEHLYEGTYSNNTMDSINRRRFVQMGETHHSNKLTENQVKEIRQLAQKYTIRKLAKMYQVSFGMIGHIIKRRSWKHI